MRVNIHKQLLWLAAGGLLMVGALSTNSYVHAQTGDVKERADIDAKYKWDLSALYASDAAWEADVAEIEKRIPEIKAMEGSIGQSADNLLAYFRLTEAVNLKADNAFVYAFQSYDQDTRDQHYSAFKERISNVATLVGEAASWFAPELVSIPEATFERWYKEKPELAVYKQYIDNQLRTRKYTLSPAEEKILALSGNIARTASSANVALREADLTFPTVKDESGNDVEISEGRMLSLYESPDPRVRRDAAMALLRTYGQFKNTTAALMNGNIAGDIFYARSRGYQSTLHASLDNDNIDTTVYLNLVETVRKHAPVLQKYVDIRRRALGLDEIHPYDMFAPLLPETRQNVPYEQAVASIVASMAPLGKDYVAPMQAGFDSRWVDVYENKGKRSGAYSWGSYSSHPYMLLNYNNTLDDMFTVTHEMGHCMHTWYSHKHQPYVYSGYALFNAEVASTFNEALLMELLLKKERDPAKRLYLINQYIDQIRGTLITQVQFADFELRMHRAAEAGEPLTAENLGKLYVSTMRDYYGDGTVIDEEYAFTWIRIPHFYRNFYVYKYATSYAASQALSQKVLKGEKGAKEAYIKFLSGGSSKYPLDLLRDGGVDMSTPAPVETTMKKFSELVNEMEILLKQLGKI